MTRGPVRAPEQLAGALVAALLALSVAAGVVRTERSNAQKSDQTVQYWLGATCCIKQIP